MVARYFESQVYRTEAVMYNLLGVVGAYKMDKDKNFETKKNNLLNLVFNKEGTMNKIGSVRNQFHPATASELKIT